MSLLSGLMKIGGLVAAPFSGGASLALTGAGSVMDKIGGAAGAAGQVLGAQQGGANNARVAQGQLDLSRDRNVLDRYQIAQGAQHQAAQTDLERKGFESNNRASTAKQALIGALLSGPIDRTRVQGGQASGGLLAALQRNPEALAAMHTLNGQASQAQATPLRFTGGDLLKAPDLSAAQHIDPGGGVMGTITKIAQLMGAVSPYLKQSNPYAVEPE